MIDSFYIRLVVVFAAVNGLGIAFYQAMHGWGISDGAGATGNFVCIAGILIYVVGFREHMTRSTIILLMILYIVYSFLEVFSILQLSKTKHH